MKGKGEPSIWSAFTWSWIVCNSFHRWERSSLSPYQSVLPALLSFFFNKPSSYSKILLCFLLPGIFSGRTIPCNEYIASSTITLFTGQVFLLLWKTYSLLRFQVVVTSQYKYFLFHSFVWDLTSIAKVGLFLFPIAFLHQKWLTRRELDSIDMVNSVPRDIALIFLLFLHCHRKEIAQWHVKRYERPSDWNKGIETERYPCQLKMSLFEW